MIGWILSSKRPIYHMKKILTFTFLLVSFTCLTQYHVYVGQGFGAYRHFQGPLETNAWVFNNHTDVTKEMSPNRNFSGLILGAVVNAGRMSFGMDWASKKNKFTGKRESASVKVVDTYLEKLNTFYINLGIGNKAENADSKQILWRVQTAFGFYKFKLSENLSGTNEDFNGTLGLRKGISSRMGLYLLFPITSNLNINVVPFFEFDTGGGYVEILEERYRNSEYFNITNYGINFNLDYGF